MALYPKFECYATARISALRYKKEVTSCILSTVVLRWSHGSCGFGSWFAPLSVRGLVRTVPSPYLNYGTPPPLCSCSCSVLVPFARCCSLPKCHSRTISRVSLSRGTTAHPCMQLIERYRAITGQVAPTAARLCLCTWKGLCGRLQDLSTEGLCYLTAQPGRLTVVLILFARSDQDRTQFGRTPRQGCLSELRELLLPLRLLPGLLSMDQRTALALARCESWAWPWSDRRQRSKASPRT